MGVSHHKAPISVLESMTLDAATGVLLETDSSFPDGTYHSSVDVREVVEALPADFVAQLGTERVEHS